MYQISNYTGNDDIKVLGELGAFRIIEYARDLSVAPEDAATAWSGSLNFTVERSGKSLIGSAASGERLSWHWQGAHDPCPGENHGASQQVTA